MFKVLPERVEKHEHDGFGIFTYSKSSHRGNEHKHNLVKEIASLKDKLYPLSKHWKTYEYKCCKIPNKADRLSKPCRHDPLL